MSRVQSFTSMVAWRKSECCNVLYSYSRNVERVASLQSRLDVFKRAFESGAPPYNAEHEAIGKDASSDSSTQGVGN